MNLNFVHAKSNVEEGEIADKGDEGQNEWDTLAKKYEELEARMAEQLETEQGDDKDGPPIIRAPDKPTKEQWERRQIIHIPYASWCPHCVAARNARRNHPTDGRNRQDSSRH